MPGVDKRKTFYYFFPKRIDENDYLPATIIVNWHFEVKKFLRALRHDYTHRV
jgi:hypothetical protein